jgi:hypothetical protein
MKSATCPFNLFIFHLNEFITRSQCYLPSSRVTLLWSQMSSCLQTGQRSRKLKHSGDRQICVYCLSCSAHCILINVHLSYLQVGRTCKADTSLLTHRLFRRILCQLNKLIRNETWWWLSHAQFKQKFLYRRVAWRSNARARKNVVQFHGKLRYLWGIVDDWRETWRRSVQNIWRYSEIRGCYVPGQLLLRELLETWETVPWRHHLWMFFGKQLASWLWETPLAIEWSGQREGWLRDSRESEIGRRTLAKVICNSHIRYIYQNVYKIPY